MSQYSYSEERYKTKNSYDETKGLANSVTDANGNTTNYTYDANTDEMTAMTGTVDGNGVSVYCSALHMRNFVLFI